MERNSTPTAKDALAPNVSIAETEKNKALESTRSVQCPLISLIRKLDTPKCHNPPEGLCLIIYFSVKKALTLGLSLLPSVHLVVSYFGDNSSIALKDKKLGISESDREKGNPTLGKLSGSIKKKLSQQAPQS